MNADGPAESTTAALAGGPKESIVNSQYSAASRFAQVVDALAAWAPWAAVALAVVALIARLVR